PGELRGEPDRCGLQLPAVTAAVRQLADPCAEPFAPRQKSLRLKLFEDGHDRPARDIVLLGKVARRWQPNACVETAHEDCAAKLLMEPPRETNVGGTFPERHFERSCSARHKRSLSKNWYNDIAQSGPVS